MSISHPCIDITSIDETHPCPTADRFVRKLRGGSQAHLIKADDGHFYATKSPDNPQTKRVLVNEYLGAKVFAHLGISTAKIKRLDVPQSFLDAYPEVHLVSHKQRIPFRAGIHLGSRFAVDPERVPIYDMLPAVMVPRIGNAGDFLGALVADQWLSNHDFRQFVYFRDQTLGSIEGRGFRALAIDHGMCLGGPTGQLLDSPLAGVCFDASIYRSIRSSGDIERWLEKLKTIGKEHFQSWIKEIPSEWMEGDEFALRNLIDKLMIRQKRVPGLVEAAIRTSGQMH